MKLIQNINEEKPLLSVSRFEREGEESKVGLVSHFGSKEEAFDFACTRFKSIVADILK